MSKVIGIDAGTTFSVASYINEEGKVIVIPNSEGKYLTPSVFSVTKEGTILVGDKAISEEEINVVNTIRSIKRSMGTATRKQLWDKEYSPEEVTASILRKITKDAETYTGKEVKQAVITVPAYFNNDQRTSTKIAGKLAGLEVLRIINEPTAAALAYGLGKNKNEKILVFDLGGGTFDVTVLNIIDSNVFEVLSTSGDTQLGGDDFDQTIIDYLIETMNLDMKILPYPVVRATLRTYAETAKIALSDAEEYIFDQSIIILNNIYKLNIKITKEQFEKFISGYLIKIKNCMLMAIRDAKIKITDIDKIVLVGGSTRIPIVRYKIKEWMGLEPDTSIDPDLAVGIGAGIQASLLTGQSTEDILLIDVTPLSLGIEASGGMMIKMIERNTTIPVDKQEIFSTAEDNQDTVAIRVYQGERPRAKDNNNIGEFKLEKITPAPRGVPQISVDFQIDVNGILSVVAKDEATGQYKKVTITGSSSLSSEEIERILKEAEESQEEDKQLEQKFIIIKSLQDKLIQIDRILDKTEELLTSDQENILLTYQTDITKAITNNNLEDLNILNEKAKTIMNKISQKMQEKAKSIMEKYQEELI